MQKILYGAVLALALSACGGSTQDEARVDPAHESTAPATEAAATEPAVVDEIANVLGHIQRQAALSVRYDRPRTVEQSVERQVYVEMLGSTAEQTEALAVAAFETAGFTSRRGLADANGVRMQFRKKGAEHINALIRDQAASPPFKDPAGTSSLYLRQVQMD